MSDFIAGLGSQPILPWLTLKIPILGELKY